jgi:hypothetical protein
LGRPAVEAEITRRGWTLERVGAAAYGCAQGGWRARKGAYVRGGYRLEHVVEQVREHDAWEAERRMQQYIPNEIVTGDARALAPSIPDASVDLVFTDPVYDRIEDYRWLAQTAARVLKPGGALLAFYETKSLPETLTALSTGLRFRWQFIEYRSNGVKVYPAPGGGTLYVGLLWFDTGASRPRFVWDVKIAAMTVAKSTNHMWSKPPTTILYYLEKFTAPSALVYDPFAGGGTVPAVCKMLGRTFLASEIDPATAERARERLANTQPPLPGLVVEQAGLDLSAA